MLAAGQHVVGPRVAQRRPFAASTVKPQTLVARGRLDGAELPRRPDWPVLLFAGQHPCPRHVPCAPTGVREILIGQPLSLPRVKDLRVFGTRPDRSKGPIPVDLITSAVAFYEHRLVKHELRHHRPAAQAIRVNRDVIEVAHRERTTDLSLGQRRDRAERRSGHPYRQRVVGAVDRRRAGIVPVVNKPAGPVIEPAIEKAAMQRNPDVSGRCQIARAQRAVDEVEVGDPGELLESERDFELPRSDLQRVADVGIHIDILPCGLLVHVRIRILHFALGELSLDGELHAVEQLAFDSDTRTVNLEVVEVGRIVTRIARVPLKLSDEVHSEETAVAYLRMIAPAELDIARRRARGGCLLRDRGRACRRWRREKSRWQQRQQPGEHAAQHAVSPSVIGGGTFAASLAATIENRPATSATAAGSVTVTATSRRKSRLMGFSDSPPTTASRSSTSMIFPCDLRPQSRFPSYNSTRTPSDERVRSSDINAGSDAFRSISRTLDEASAIIDVNCRRALSGPTISRGDNRSGR